MHASVEAPNPSLSRKKGNGVAGHGDMPEMLTAKDLEAWLKIDVKTIYAYVQKGLIPYVRIQSNVRFRRDEVLDWITQHSFEPRANRKDGRERRS